MDIAFTPYDVVRVHVDGHEQTGVVTDYSFRWTDDSCTLSEPVFRVYLGDDVEREFPESVVTRIGRLVSPFSFGERVRVKDAEKELAELHGLSLEVIGMSYCPRSDRWGLAVAGHPSGHVWAIEASDVYREMEIHWKFQEETLPQNMDEFERLQCETHWRFGADCYPSNTWTDFAVVMQWWLQALIDLHHFGSASFTFMDGPQEVHAKRAGASIKLTFRSSDAVWEVEPAALAGAIIGTAEAAVEQASSLPHSDEWRADICRMVNGARSLYGIAGA